ncbi:RGP1 family protein [Megaselia abdita]
MKHEDILGNDTNDDLTPTNPFLEKRDVTELEISWHHIRNLTARRLPKFYRITNKRGYVGRFCLFKSFYKLGEDVVGSLDFTNYEVKCVQFTVKLQSEELLNSQNEHETMQQPGNICTYTNYHEICLSMQQTQVILPIPLYLTPTFKTDLIDVRWRLHFEFVSSTVMNYGDVDVKTGEWNAPSEIPVETMIWNLPITIYSANPLQMYSPALENKLIVK